MNRKSKNILASTIIITIIALSLFVVFLQNGKSSNSNINSASSDLSRIACMGDSITNMTEYPHDLQTLLGSKSTVGNFGYNGAAVNFYSDRTYYFSDSYKAARSFQPTMVLIMLGTNDARINLNDSIGNFTANYEHMVNAIINGSGTRRFVGNPQVYLILPPPIFSNNLNLTSSVYSDYVIPKIHEVANFFDLPIIDVYTPLVNHPEFFSDGVHPTAIGAKIIADTIYQAIES